MYSDFKSRRALADFSWTLIRTNFKARYHGELSGFAWAILKPLSTFTVLAFVFSHVFQNSREYTANLLIGLVLWDFFSESTRTGLESLQAKSFLLTKARVPAWVLVVTSSTNALLTLSIFSSVFFLYLGMHHHAPSVLGIGLYALYLLHMLVMVIGFSLGASVLFLKYRDVNQVWEVALQAGFFVAPIVYPLQVLPERLHIYLYFWPITPVVQFARAVLIDGTIPTFKAHLLLTGLTLFVLGMGALIFRRFAQLAVEEL
jgi:lipopolysaccharide transport system permease protein